MADVTGPIASLPGSFHTVPQGMACDECGKPATVRVQGETDSMGSEMHDLCAECAAKHTRLTSITWRNGFGAGARLGREG